MKVVECKFLVDKVSETGIAQPVFYTKRYTNSHCKDLLRSELSLCRYL